MRVSGDRDHAAERAEEAAFDDLFVRCLPRAYRVAIRIVGDRCVAEEMAAEALARAYAEWPKVRENPYADAWVLRVVTNLAIDHARRRRYTAVLPFRSVSEDPCVAQSMALRSALAALPKRQAEAIVFRYLVGFTAAEAASNLGLSQNTFSTHVRRGMETLRRHLGADKGEVELTSWIS